MNDQGQEESRGDRGVISDEETQSISQRAQSVNNNGNPSLESFVERPDGSGPVLNEPSPTERVSGPQNEQDSVTAPQVSAYQYYPNQYQPHPNPYYDPNWNHSFTNHVNPNLVATPPPPGSYSTGIPLHPPPPPPPPPYFTPSNPVLAFMPPTYPMLNPSGPNNAQAFAAGAAWAAAQIAQAAADYASIGTHPFPSPHSWFPAGNNNNNNRMHPWYSYPPPPWENAPNDNTMPVENNNQNSAGNRPQLPTDQENEFGGDEEDALNNTDSRDRPRHSHYPDRSRGTGHYRRKRQQRPAPQHEEEGFCARPSNKQHQAFFLDQQQQLLDPGEKIRRRLRSDGESSSSSSSFYPHPDSFGNYHTTMSSSSRRQYKKKKSRSDESLLGKTAVSALYEWCSKRQRTPIFVELSATEESNNTNTNNLAEQEFDFTVALNDEEDVPLGRGRGTTKSAAKQLAARRALQSLVPGVVFDMATGILVQLPNQTSVFHSIPPARRTASEVAADDLAPTLAKRLAIGRESGPTTNNNEEVIKTRSDLDTAGFEQQQQQQSRGEANVGTEQSNVPDENEPIQAAVPAGKKERGPSLSKRSLDATHTYPSTTTSGDEEDENEYYTGRGASVCSALLHAMVQIDPRIPEAPQYSFQVADQTLLPNLRRRVDPVCESQTAIRVHRGPFSCTARLKLQVTEKNTDEDESNSRPNNNEENKKMSSLPDAADSKLAAVSPAEQILEAVGVGGTKREARHVASAKLLALLFPECNTMVEVKAAAEEAREMYAASKAMSKQHQGSSAVSTPGHENHQSANPRPYVLPTKMDQPVPDHVMEDVKSIHLTGKPASDVCSRSHAVLKQHHLDMAAQHSSRQKQLDAQVETALHALNEQDEEGRSLPAGREVSEDDVGRTVLRRATEEEDLARMEKLFSCTKKSKVNLVPAAACDQDENEPISGRSSAVLLLPDSPSGATIALLLCRAIAPYDDPPLGCAVLTMGFSMEAGRLLRIVQIATEPHLPQERFLECLEDFSRHMKCSLVTDDANRISNASVISKSELRLILQEHMAMCSDEMSSQPPNMEKLGRNRITSSLQSVKEESEVSDASACADKRDPRRASKPSKRTRVE